MTLYEIDQQINEFLLFAQENELTEDEIKDTLDSLKMDRADKIDNIACYYKNLLAESEAIKLEEAKLRDRRQVKENRATRLKEYLARALDGNKFETARVKCSWRKSETVEVEDIKQLPDKFLRYKDPEADKSALKTALKAGQEIKGAHLVANNNLSVK